MGKSRPARNREGYHTMKKTITIKEHVLMPKHTKLSDKEKKELFERYNISPRELPKMLKSDAALIDLHVEAGDVIKITRVSPSTGATSFYRGVVND